MKFCTNCGAPLNGKNFCTKCGIPVANTQPTGGYTPKYDDTPKHDEVLNHNDVPKPKYTPTYPMHEDTSRHDDTVYVDSKPQRVYVKLLVIVAVVAMLGVIGYLLTQIETGTTITNVTDTSTGGGTDTTTTGGTGTSTTEGTTIGGTGTSTTGGTTTTSVGKSTYDEVVKEFMQACFDKDVEKILSLMPEQINEEVIQTEYDGDKSEVIAYFEEEIDSELEDVYKYYGDMSKVTYQIIGVENFDSEDMEDLNDEIADYGIQANDAKDVTVSLNELVDGEKQTLTWDIILFKIGNYWYLGDSFLT